MDKAFWFYEIWGLKVVKYNPFEDSFIIPLTVGFHLEELLDLKYDFGIIEATSLEGSFWNVFFFDTPRFLLVLYLYFFSA